MTGFVYFIEAAESGRVKVGFSKNVKARLASLQTASYEPLRLVVKVEGDESFERRLHEFLEPWHVRGEWYSDLDSIRGALNSFRLMIDSGGRAIGLVVAA